MSKSLIWFITGTSRGLGSHLTRIALARGDRVIATARSLEKIRHLESETCKILQLDVTDSEEAIRATAKTAVDIWGHVDVVVNNAGIGAPAVAEEAGYAGFMTLFASNFFSVVNVNNAFLPYMRAAKSGTIVIIGSRHAWFTKNPGLAPYNAAKAAVHAYGETIRNELAPFGVRVLIAQPGAHRTDIIATARTNNIVTYIIPEYEAMKKASFAKYEQQNGKQPGDPEKAMTAVVDLVRGEGVAAGREMPQWLVLGSDAEQNLRDHCAERLKNLDEWQEVSRGCAVNGEFVLV